jgi:membrane-bound lytic murein transglycosylase A
VAVPGSGPLTASLRPRFGVVVVCLAVAACASTPPAEKLARRPLEIVPEHRWPILADDLGVESLLAAAQQSVEYFESVPEETVYAFGSENRTARQMAAGMIRFRTIVRSEPDPHRRAEMLKRDFVLMRSVGRDGHGGVLFTGYFEPILEARREREPPFEHPIYGVPDDLVTINLEAFGLQAQTRQIVGRVDDHQVVPYAERGVIDFGPGLTAPAPVLGYVADPVDLFFLHVQGSGTLVFPDNTRLRVGYAVANGREYRSIGRLLIDDGVISDKNMSMQAIRAYLAANPQELRRVLSYNPSYVFFRPLASAGGPLGCYGVPLTAGRSIATDRRLFPAPVVAWIEGGMPGPDGEEVPFARFALNQDTGGSIRGPGRVDVFIGAGAEAGEIAGRMKHPGRFYLLLPRSI